MNLHVKVAHFPNEVMFGASSHDPESYGRELFARAITGEFGPISDYISQLPPPLQYAAENAHEMTVVQAEIAPLVAAKELGEATQEELDRLTLLRRELVRLYRAEQTI
ncbi:hypothetical protein D3C85_1692260 [compost metagenome]